MRLRPEVLPAPNTNRRNVPSQQLEQQEEVPRAQAQVSAKANDINAMLGRRQSRAKASANAVPADSPVSPDNVNKMLARTRKRQGREDTPRCSSSDEDGAKNLYPLSSQAVKRSPGFDSLFMSDSE